MEKEQVERKTGETRDPAAPISKGNSMERETDKNMFLAIRIPIRIGDTIPKDLLAFNTKEENGEVINDQLWSATEMSKGKEEVMDMSLPPGAT